MSFITEQLEIITTLPSDLSITKTRTIRHVPPNTMYYDLHTNNYKYWCPKCFNLNKLSGVPGWFSQLSK